MKTHILNTLLILVILGCSANKAQETEEAKKVERTEEVEDGSDLAPTTNRDLMIREALFSHLRSRIVNGENIMVISESLEIKADTFKYVVVEADLDQLLMQASADEPDLSISDSTIVKGHFELTPSDNDVDDSETLSLQGEWFHTYLLETSYGYDGTTRRRMGGADYYEDSFLVKENQSQSLLNELYLKARVVLLTIKDLEGKSVDELAYLRNEIFARHGHSFKTEKMSEYFDSKPWYHRVFSDATPFLNEIEKANVQFIKSHE